MRKAAYLVLLIMLAIPFTTDAQEVLNGEQLTLEQCISTALRMHPGIIASRYSVDAVQSRIGQAQSAFYPQLNLSAGYSRVSPVTLAANVAVSDAAVSKTFDQYTGTFTLSQLITDFGKTRAQVNIQKYNLEASSSDLQNTAEQIIFNVKQAYYGVLKAKRNREVADETVKQFQLHLEQARGFYEVGTKPKFDVTKAEVDLSNAKLTRIKAGSSLNIAIVILNNAMGLPYAPQYSIEDNLAFLKYPVTQDSALEMAFQRRQDLKSLVEKRKAAEESVKLATRGYYPVLTGNASYTKQGERFPLEDGWNIGLNLSFPIFSGFLTKHQVDEAVANLNAIKANEDSLRQSILLDVQQAFLNLQVAEESIANTELTVRQAVENFEIANGRYAAGVGNPIEVTDAEVALSNARTANIQALYDYKTAQASMERAIGTR